MVSLKTKELSEIIQHFSIRGSAPNREMAARIDKTEILYKPGNLTPIEVCDGGNDCPCSHS